MKGKKSLIWATCKPPPKKINLCFRLHMYYNITGNCKNENLKKTFPYLPTQIFFNMLMVLETKVFSFLA